VRRWRFGGIPVHWPMFLAYRVVTPSRGDAVAGGWAKAASSAGPSISTKGTHHVNENRRLLALQTEAEGP